MRSRPRRDAGADADEAGFGRGGSRRSLLAPLARAIPPAIARLAIAVSVETDREVYERDDPVAITVSFENRLPVPVELPTPRQRRWGWTVDGLLEATDERRYTPARPATFDFRGGERKRITVTWNGRLERVRNGGRRESVVPEPDEYEIRAFVATGDAGGRPSDSTTIILR